MIVLDASALIALLKDEPGADLVIDRLPRSIMSTVNLAETLSRVAEDGGDVVAIKSELDASPITFVPVSEDHALAIAQLRPATKAFGLSLGDRACFAIAIQTGLPVLTADRTWERLDLGVKVVLIR